MAASVQFTDAYGVLASAEVLSSGFALTSRTEEGHPRCLYLSKKKARLLAKWILKNVPEEV